MCTLQITLQSYIVQSLSNFIMIQCFRTMPTCVSPSFDDKKIMPAMQIIENNNNYPPKENKENSKPVVAIVHTEGEVEEEPAQIIPWRAQLRKTNSTLNLLE